jgi:hypothetical protein
MFVEQIKPLIEVAKSMDLLLFSHRINILVTRMTAMFFVGLEKHRLIT